MNRVIFSFYYVTFFGVKLINFVLNTYQKILQIENEEKKSTKKGMNMEEIGTLKETKDTNQKQNDWSAFTGYVTTNKFLIN